MNNRNKSKNIEKANLILEQSYLKSKGLLKENQTLDYLKNIVGGDVKNDQLQLDGGKLIQIEGDNIIFTNLSDDGEDFTKGPKEFNKDEIIQKINNTEKKQKFILSLFP